jgi:dCMP deaminase
MAKQEKLDNLFLDIADRISEMSYARRLKVGSVLVKDGNIISMGWNGTPAGMDNNCEYENSDGELVTKPEVLHSESNTLMKLSASGGFGAKDATLYTKYSPCPECAKLIKQALIKRVVYREVYRLPEGVEMLQKMGIECIRL